MVRGEGVWPQARQTGQRQQADGDQTTKTQQHVDSLGLLELGSLDVTAGFEALMELLDTPALFIPLNTLGRVIGAVYGPRGEQQPFDTIPIIPATDDAGGEWGTAGQHGVVAWGQHLGRVPGEIQMERARRLSGARPLGHDDLALGAEVSGLGQEVAVVGGSAIGEDPRQAVPVTGHGRAP